MTTEQAYQSLCDQFTHHFLTGPAGTGKSTLIRKFIEEHPNECIVVAPTGIASVNIGGETIHKFFHLPARTVSFNSIKFLDERNPIDMVKKRIIRRARYLIIDEISMVRADLMDAIFWFLSKNGLTHLKFIMVGDINQLPPVIASEEEKEMLTKRYGSEYFFSAQGWKERNFETITLSKIWRQTDAEFIRILGTIKNNCVSHFDIDRINAVCVKNEELDPDMGVMLCTTNSIANAINAEMISRLDGEYIRLEGVKTGNFDTKNCTVEPIIELKKGCKIMTMRNGPGYYNGSVGVFEEMVTKDSMRITVNGQTLFVDRHEFKSIQYNYDEGEDKITCDETGKFIQFPVKVAYAMTIHKSQGCTFDKVIIDFGEKGAFAHGQAYVALSRCTTLEGITLRNPLQKKDFIYSKAVLEFNKKAQFTNPFQEDPTSILDDLGLNSKKEDFKL
jgi:ATP-dependent DNA helicase PIF1